MGWINRKPFWRSHRHRDCRRLQRHAVAIPGCTVPNTNRGRCATASDSPVLDAFERPIWPWWITASTLLSMTVESGPRIFAPWKITNGRQEIREARVERMGTHPPSLERSGLRPQSSAGHGSLPGKRAVRMNDGNNIQPCKRCAPEPADHPQQRSVHCPAVVVGIPRSLMIGSSPRKPDRKIAMPPSSPDGSTRALSTCSGST